MSRQGDEMMMPQTDVTAVSHGGGADQKRPYEDLAPADILILLQQGYPNRAIEEVMSRLGEDLDNAELWDVFIRIMRALNETDLALSNANTAVWRCPASVTLTVHRGELLHALERDREAEAAYRMALILDPDHHVVRQSLAGLLQSVGRFDDALTLLCEVEPEDIARARLWVKKAEMLARENESDVAIAAFRKAMALAPSWPEPYAALGRHLMVLGRNHEAAPLFGRAAALDREAAERQNEWGRACFDVGLDAAAAMAFQRAIVLEPGRVSGYLGLAFVRRANLHPGEADRLYERAAYLDPRDARCQHALLTPRDLWMLAQGAWGGR
jgi:tetratricopeptide (TPR) repeat protein